MGSCSSAEKARGATPTLAPECKARVKTKDAAMWRKEEAGAKKESEANGCEKEEATTEGKDRATSENDSGAEKASAEKARGATPTLAPECKARAKTKDAAMWENEEAGAKKESGANGCEKEEATTEGKDRATSENDSGAKREEKGCAKGIFVPDVAEEDAPAAEAEEPAAAAEAAEGETVGGTAEAGSPPPRPQRMTLTTSFRECAATSVLAQEQKVRGMGTEAMVLELSSTAHGDRSTALAVQGERRDRSVFTTAFVEAVQREQLSWLLLPGTIRALTAGDGRFQQQAHLRCSVFKENAGQIGASLLSPVDFRRNTTGHAASGRRRALLVGPSYASTPSPTEVCANDQVALYNFLRGQGWQRDEITLLTDHDTVDTVDGPVESRAAHYANVKRAVNELADAAAAGDLLWFSFSGHGCDFVSEGHGGLRKSMLVEEDPAVLDASLGMSRTTPVVNQVTDDVDCRLRTIPDTWVHENLVSKLPKGCQLISLVDCCSSSGMLGLPCHVDLPDAVVAKINAGEIFPADALLQAMGFGFPSFKLNLGFVEVGSGGVAVKPQMMFGAEIAGVKASVGVGDVREGISVGAQVSVDLTKVEGSATSFSGILSDMSRKNVDKGLFSWLSDAMRSIIGVLSKPIMSDCGFSVGNLPGGVSMTATLSAKAGLSLGVSVCFNWAATKGYYMIGCNCSLLLASLNVQFGWRADNKGFKIVFAGGPVGFSACIDIAISWP